VAWRDCQSLLSGGKTHNNNLIQALPDVRNLKVMRFQTKAIFKNVKKLNNSVFEKRQFSGRNEGA
jgi:hypothetical protein